MHQPIVNIALGAARAAGRVIEQAMVRADQLVVESKGQNDFVTAVDRAAETAIIDAIRKAYPKHAIVTEESGRIEGAANTDTEWIVDPLDGTTNYAHGLPVFASSLALEVDGVVNVGAIYDPTRRELFTATLGGGAFLNGAPLRVSSVRALVDAMRDRRTLMTVLGVRLTGLSPRVAAWSPTLPAVLGRRVGSQGRRGAGAYSDTRAAALASSSTVASKDVALQLHS